MSVGTVDASRGGRPRDAWIEEAVLRATAELLVENGYADLSIDQIAARAGTTKPAIYRRWKGKARLVHEAAFPLAAIDVGRLRAGREQNELADDVRDMVESAASILGAPVARAAFPGLMAEFQADPSLHQLLLERFGKGPMAWAAERLEAAVRSGEARSDLEVGTAMAGIAGAVLYRLVVETAAPFDDEWVERTARFVLRGILP